MKNNPEILYKLCQEYGKEIKSLTDFLNKIKAVIKDGHKDPYLMRDKALQMFQEYEASQTTLPCQP